MARIRTSAARNLTAGWNPLVLQLHAVEHHFQSRWWGTYRQWHDLGCFIKRRPDSIEPGKWGCNIVVYIPIVKEVVDPKTGIEEEEKYWLLRKFVVFNAEQVEGMAAKEYQDFEIPDTKLNAKPDYEPAEELIQAAALWITKSSARRWAKSRSP